MQKHHQAVGIFKKESAKTEPERGGPSPTAPRDAERAERRERSTPTGEKGSQSTEYVVDRAIDSRADGYRTFHRVRWYAQSSNDDTRKAEEH